VARLGSFAKWSIVILYAQSERHASQHLWWGLADASARASDVRQLGFAWTLATADEKQWRGDEKGRR
jgi:hypothetical protein